MNGDPTSPDVCPRCDSTWLWSGPIYQRRWWQLWRRRWTEGPADFGGCLECDWEWQRAAG